MPSGKKIKAIANLARQFWIHTFRRAFFKPKPGIEKEKFKEYYRDDKIAQLNGDERRQLQEYQKCINCGTCASVCPVYGPATHGYYRAPDSIAASLSRSFPELGAARDSVYNCTQCGYCGLKCPVGIDVPGLIMMSRQKAVQAGESPIRNMYGERLAGLEKYGNVHGAGAEKFAEYSKEKADYVFFVGCAGSVLSSAETLKWLELLKALGVDFTVVADVCCGGFHRSAGMLGQDSPVVKNTLERIRATGTNRVLTACPHGLFTMRTHPEYKMNISVEHVVQFLSKLMPDFARERTPVTYHDPCFLGRRLGIYDAPRTLIAMAGAKLIEMPRNREKAYCCGSMDGEFIVDAKVSRAMAAERAAEAAATGASVLLTACSSCTRTLSDAAAGMRVISIAEFLLERLKR